MGVAWHGEYFAWFEVGRTDLLRERGCTYRELEARRPAPARDRGPRPLPAPGALRRRARDPHRAASRWAARAWRSPTRSTARATARPAGHRLAPRHAAVDPHGPAAPAARGAAAAARSEGRWSPGAAGFIGSHLAEQPARATATRSSGVDAFVDYYPRAVKERNLARARATTARFRFVGGRAAGPGPRARPRRRRPRSSTSPPRRACAPPGAATSPSTPTTTCWPPSACWRRRWRRACRASSTPPRRRSTATPASLPLREDAPCRPVSPYGVTKLAAEHLGRLYEREPRPARGEPALLHGLRPAAAAGHGVPPVPEGRAATGSPSASTGTASRPATSRSSTTSWPATRAAADSGPARAASTTWGGGSASPLNDVLRADRGGHGPQPRGRAGGGPEGRHEGHLRRHVGRPAGPGLPLDGQPARGAGAANGSGSGGRREARAPPAPPAARPGRRLRQRRRARHRDAGQQLGPGHLGGRAEGAAKKQQWESARQHFRRIIDGFPQSEYGPAARLALGRHLLPGGRDRQLHPGRRRLPRVPDPLPLPSRRATTPSSRSAEAFFQQQNGPDRDQTPTREGPRGVPAAARALPRLPAGRGGPRRGSRSAARAWRGPSSWPATSTSGRGRPAARPSPATRACSTSTPTTSGLDEVLFRLGECLDAQRAARPRRCPTSARLLEEYPNSELRRRGPRADGSSARRPRPPPPAPASPPSPTPVAQSRQPATAPAPAAVSSSVTLELCKKGLDEPSLFLLASAKIPAACERRAGCRSSKS